MLKTLRARNNPTDPVEVRLFLSFSHVFSRDHDSRMIQTHRICYQRVRRNLVAGNDEKYVSKVCEDSRTVSYTLENYSATMAAREEDLTCY